MKWVKSGITAVIANDWARTLKVVEAFPNPVRLAQKRNLAELSQNQFLNISLTSRWWQQSNFRLWDRVSFQSRYGRRDFQNIWEQYLAEKQASVAYGVMDLRCFTCLSTALPFWFIWGSKHCATSNSGSGTLNRKCGPTYSDQMWSDLYNFGRCVCF